jgi:hypothetical protein
MLKRKDCELKGRPLLLSRTIKGGYVDEAGHEWTQHEVQQAWRRGQSVSIDGQMYPPPGQSILWSNNRGSQ